MVGKFGFENLLKSPGLTLEALCARQPGEFGQSFGSHRNLSLARRRDGSKSLASELVGPGRSIEPCIESRRLVPQPRRGKPFVESRGIAKRVPYKPQGFEIPPQLQERRTSSPERSILIRIALEHSTVEKLCSHPVATLKQVIGRFQNLGDFRRHLACRPDPGVIVASRPGSGCQAETQQSEHRQSSHRTLLGLHSGPRSLVASLLTWESRTHERIQSFTVRQRHAAGLEGLENG